MCQSSLALGRLLRGVSFGGVTAGYSLVAKEMKMSVAVSSVFSLIRSSEAESEQLCVSKDISLVWILSEFCAHRLPT